MCDVAKSVVSVAGVAKWAELLPAVTKVPGSNLCRDQGDSSLSNKNEDKRKGPSTSVHPSETEESRQYPKNIRKKFFTSGK